MDSTSKELIITDDVAAEKLISQLKRELRHVDSSPERTVLRVYYDTFDGRLRQAGCTLSVEKEPGHERSELRQLGSGHLILQAPMPVAKFFWDNPPGPLRDFLAKYLEVRALLPLIEIRTSVRTHTIRDKRGKALLNIVNETGAANLPDESAQVKLKPRLRLEPVRGYSETLLQVSALIHGNGTYEAEEDILDEALKALARPPRECQPKPSLPLTHDTPTIRALVAILLHLCNVMEQNLDGTVEDLDSEFLHDFRVAVRRSRSALAQLKGVFPADSIRQFVEELKWLGGITGPTRDLDVYLLKFPDYRESLPKQIRPDLDPFLHFLQRHQRQEQKRLARHLRSPRLRTLLDGWREYLESPLDAENLTPVAAAPVGDVARRRIWKTYGKFIREGEAIRPESPDRAVHELRITGKKLRYLLEFFQSLYPKKLMLQLVKGMKMMQDFLGDFQDLTVQQEHLHDFSEQMKSEGDVPAATLLAMGRLVEDMARRQRTMRLDFHDHFAGFNRGRHRRVFEGLFGPGQGEDS